MKEIIKMILSFPFMVIWIILWFTMLLFMFLCIFIRDDLETAKQETNRFIKFVNKYSYD